MKYFNKGCQILLLLLPFIFTLQEAYADNSSSTGQQSDFSNSSPNGGFLIDKFNNVIKSIENLLPFRSKKYEVPKNKTHKRESEGITYSFYDYDNKYEEPHSKKPSKNIPTKFTGKSRKGE